MNEHLNDVIQKKIDTIKQKKNIYELGLVTNVHDYILEVSGLENAAFSSTW